jgi:sterol desaturase/sphingolipid hydroxylase (fatty acid hydroxylase superfamily)
VGRTIALATPVFFALIALEYLVGRMRGRSNYRLNDAVNSLSLGIMSQVLGLFTRALTIGIYAAVYSAVAIRQLPADQWWVWVLGIVAYDFCYYWFHRIGHESAVFWASHVVHHQSQEYNLTTALRQTSSSALLGWIFYLPMAIAGIPPEVFAVTAIVNLLYQYWIHTEQVGKLGWFDRWFSSPSNHRVHHAVNDRYIDRNYGGIFMIWDRMFGSFVEETERCVYGTRAPLDSWDPLWANLEVYADLARKSWHASRWRDRLLVWIMPPGWQPALATGAHWEKPHFDVARLRRYDPPIGRGARWFAATQFVAVLLGTAPLLWFAPSLPFAELAAWSAATIAVLWITGAVMQGRLRVPVALAIEAAAAVLLAVSLQATAEPAPMPVIVDDAVVQEAVESARAEFLSGQDFDRLQVTMLAEDKRGRWRRGSVGGVDLAYPASCVKLGYLVGAVHWCAAQGKKPDCLDEAVRPMIVDSDNVATGVVVDAITGAPNGPVEGADEIGWLTKRRYTELVLADAGLLGNQRLLNKTYPTNSGEEPTWLEALARQQLGRNAMSTDLAARLMLSIQSGAIEPQATTYMRGLLRRPTFSGESVLAGGLPPGSITESKAGWAYDTLEDILYAELPNGRRLIIAAFSNAGKQDEPEPGSLLRLNHLAELLVAQLGLAQGLPAPRLLKPAPAGNGAYAVALAPSEAGLYEVAVWYESSPTASSAVTYLIEGDNAGSRTVTLDQRVWGSRWVPLGDVRLEQGAGVVKVTSEAPGSLDPGKLRVTRWAR